jgi:signal transduction histidine kinase
MRERAARQQFLLVVALARAQRAQATAMEHRRAALEATERFEKSFGYICKCAAAASARACAARRSVVRCATKLILSRCRAGHELRNPLHGVCAGVKALQDGALSPTEVSGEFAAIAEGLALMVSVTNDMTDLRKLRAGRFTVDLAPCSLRRLLESCVLSVLPAAGGVASALQLSYDARSVPDTVSGDARRERARIFLCTNFCACTRRRW